MSAESCGPECRIDYLATALVLWSTLDIRRLHGAAWRGVAWRGTRRARAARTVSRGAPLRPGIAVAVACPSVLQHTTGGAEEERA